MKSVQIIQELKTGQRVLSFQVILISQTIMHEEVFPCAVQLCNKSVVIKEQLVNPLRSEWFQWKTQCPQRQTAELWQELWQNRQRNIFQITCSMPCIYKVFVTAHVLKNPKHRFTLMLLYKLCPLLRLKGHVPLSLKPTDASILISVLFWLFHQTQRHKNLY